MKLIALESPFTGGPVGEVTEIRTYEMRGQKFAIAVTCYRCVDTGELFSTGEQDEQFMAELHQQWRTRNHVPSPAALTERREVLGLSGREASQLLGFGINQFGQYEAGELPSESNTLLLNLFCNERQLKYLLGARMHALHTRTIKKLQQVLRQQGGVPLVRSGAVVTAALDAQVWAGTAHSYAAAVYDAQAIRSYTTAKARKAALEYAPKAS